MDVYCWLALVSDRYSYQQCKSRCRQAVKNDDRQRGRQFVKNERNIKRNTIKLYSMNLPYRVHCCRFSNTSDRSLFSPLHYRQIPSAYAKVNGGTAIPLPATVMVQRRCPPDKVRPLPPTPNHTPCKWIRCLNSLGAGEGNVLKSRATLRVPGLFTTHKQISVQPGNNPQ